MNCKVCQAVITDPDFAAVWYQEEYPHIDIGPYCEQCIGKIKVCSGCQHPFLYTEVTHTGNGDHFCAGCLSSMDICTECSTRVSEGAFVLFGEKKLCTRCFNNNYFKCPICNEFHSKDDRVLKHDLFGRQRAGIFRKYGESVCTSCYHKKKKHFKEYKINTCSKCHDFYSLDDEGCTEKYCTKCYSRFGTCRDCGKKDETVKGKSVIKDDEAGLRRLCSNCLSRYKTCGHCGCFTKQVTVVKGKTGDVTLCSLCKSMKPCEVCDTLCSGGTCNSCKSNYVDNKCSKCNRVQDLDNNCRVCHGSKVYNYSLKPPIYPNYLKDKESKGNNIFFGFENECTFSGSNAMNTALKALYKKFDPTVLLTKIDGSLPNYSYEVVTQPMTLKFFQDMDLSTLLPSTLEKHSSCGLHIHISRKAFISDVHLYKVINFIHSNLKECQALAGRQLNSYCRSIDKASGHIMDAKKGSSDRHKMVNLRPKNTVEFRLFAGCVTEQELRGRVEFLHALVSFCQDASIKDAKLVDKYLDFLHKNKGVYNNAIAFWASEVM